MGDEDDRALLLLPGLQQVLLHAHPGERVECAERLVHQQDRRVHRVRAGDGAALLHAARERLGQCVGEIGESDHVDEMLSSPPALLGRSFGGLKPELDVLADREPGEQSVLLEDDAAFGTGSVDLPTIDERRDRKSTRLNSSHVANSYAVFCLNKINPAPHSALDMQLLVQMTTVQCSESK